MQLFMYNSFEKIFRPRQTKVKPTPAPKDILGRVDMSWKVMDVSYRTMKEEMV